MHKPFRIALNDISNNSVRFLSHQTNHNSFPSKVTNRKLGLTLPHIFDCMRAAPRGELWLCMREWRKSAGNAWPLSRCYFVCYAKSFARNVFCCWVSFNFVFQHDLQLPVAHTYTNMIPQFVAFVIYYFNTQIRNTPRFLNQISRSFLLQLCTRDN